MSIAEAQISGRIATGPASPAAGKVAYIMSRFPKLTETFVLYEILAMEEMGTEVAVYPLRREPVRVMHPEAEAMLDRAHFVPYLSWPIIRAQWHFLWNRPWAYFTALAALLFGTLGSLRFFAGAVVYFPKMVYFAHRMAAQRVSHVHAHFANHPAAAAFVIHRLTGIPYSFTAHGSDLHCDRTMLRRKVGEAAFVVTISEYNRTMIVDECGADCRSKVHVVHCGVDPDVFRPAGSSASNENQERRQLADLVCIGTLHEVKGQTHLIEACRILAGRGVPVRCHLIGDGPDREALEEQVGEAGLSGVVQFHGLQPRDAVAAWLKRASLVVAPSVPTRDGRREGIPVVLMEAMASGVPVVASRLSGIPELVEHGVHGLLVPPGDAVALAGAIERLCGDSEQRARMGRQARGRVLDRFNLRLNAAELARLFRASTDSLPMTGTA